MDRKKVIIIGSGPAAHTAGTYTTRANLETAMFLGFPPGGQLMTTTEVENYPGFPKGILGPDLMEALSQQSARFGAQHLYENVVSVDLSQRPFKVFGTKTKMETESLIIATGAAAKRLDVPGTGDTEFWQKGVTACAVCDGASPIFRQKELYVVGGGDTAVEEALFLTKFGSKVYIIHRRNELRASKIMAQRAISHPKIEMLWDSVLVKVEGDDLVRSVTIKNLVTNQETKRDAAGVFFAIGHSPNTGFLGNQIATHDNGYIKVEPFSTRTSVEGVFAAGDVADHVYRQAITAAGTGCMAALDAERWLSAQGIH